MTAVRAAVDELVQEWGHLDILVNGLDMPLAKGSCLSSGI